MDKERTSENWEFIAKAGLYSQNSFHDVYILLYLLFKRKIYIYHLKGFPTRDVIL